MSFGRRSSPFYRTSHTSTRPIHRLVEVLLLAFVNVSHTLTVPLTQYYGLTKEDAPVEEDVNLGLYLLIAAVLVLMGGAFAGLTIALMGQDGIYLQVIATSGEGTQQRHAQSVYRLLQKGKHWVLVTLLLSNVIVNETLPIVLDRSLGGGWPAVLGSTVLIVIFGEVIPQSVCVRYGLSIGAFMSPCVLSLMWILAPIAWPIAKLLDILLGKDHGTVYKKSGLKTLVTLHKTLGASPTERLNQDEVTIISAVLDLKDKAVGDIMTPIDDVFTMSEDTILNEETMNIILSAGYSRIPIYEPGNPKNFVGMLLVKILITYDPEDCKRVSEFALATLPETRPETSCLDIVNFFQEGKSHMVLVSEFPAENYGAIGVVTLEDVIEELIGEEIIDESDVYIDVHKAIRRLAPAPKARAQKRQVVNNSENVNSSIPEANLINLEANLEEPATQLSNDTVQNDSLLAPTNIEIDPKITFLRKGSGGPEGSGHIAIRASSSDMREHLKHLGPSNLARCPKSTRYSAVKIKSAHLPIRANSYGGLGGQYEIALGDSSRMIIEEEPDVLNSQPCDDLSTLCEDQKSLISKCAGKEANIPIFAVQNGYGSFDSFAIDRQQSQTIVNSVIDGSLVNNTNKDINISSYRSTSGRGSEHSSLNSYIAHSSDSRGTSPANTSRQKKRIVRSGSITENIIEAGGIRKLVLKTASSGELSWHEQTTNKTVAMPSMEQRGDQIHNQTATQNQGYVVGPQNYDTTGNYCYHGEEPVSSQQFSKVFDGGKRKRRKNHNGKKKGPR